MIFHCQVWFRDIQGMFLGSWNHQHICGAAGHQAAKRFLQILVAAASSWWTIHCHRAPALHEVQRLRCAPTFFSHLLSFWMFFGNQPDFCPFRGGSCLNHLKSPYFEWDSHGIPAVFGPGTVLWGPSGLLRESLLHGQQDGAAATAAAGHLFFLGEHAQHVEYRYV